MLCFLRGVSLNAVLAVRELTEQEANHVNGAWKDARADHGAGEEFSICLQYGENKYMP